jgi:hypothetical protein
MRNDKAAANTRCGFFVLVDNAILAVRSTTGLQCSCSIVYFVNVCTRATALLITTYN